MYSPIDKICIKNFRNLGDVELSFDKSPIICLLGENEAGKTSVIKAFSVCAMHANPRDQKDYIRDGTQMFGILIQLKDGHQIIRMKTAGTNKYQVKRPDGTLWETTKISEGLPVEVQSLMGLIEEPETKEFLHIRTYEDKLLFVVTQASANYKVMYNALKVEQLTKAIKNGSNEVNALRNKLNTTDTSIKTLESQLNSFNIIDLEPLVNVKDRLNKQLNALDKLEKAIQLKSNIKRCNDELGLIRLIDTYKLQEIDVSKYINLNSIGRILNRLSILNNTKNRLNGIESLELISTDKADRAKAIIDKISYIRDMRIRAGAIVDVQELNEINISTLNSLIRANSLTKIIESNKKIVDSMDTSKCIEITENAINALSGLRRISEIKVNNEQRITVLGQYNTYIGQVTEYLKQCGVAFETCQNCGSDVLVDLDKLEKIGG